MAKSFTKWGFCALFVLLLAFLQHGSGNFVSPYIEAIPGNDPQVTVTVNGGYLNLTVQEQLMKPHPFLLGKLRFTGDISSMRLGEVHYTMPIHLHVTSDNQAYIELTSKLDAKVPPEDMKFAVVQERSILLVVITIAEIDENICH